MSQDERYAAVPDFRVRGSQTLVAELAGRGPGRVLDVGCGHGHLGPMLHDLGFEVWGVENDPHRRAEAARPERRYREVFDADATRPDRFTPGAQFDVIAFADVLEHLPDPERALQGWLAHLVPGGRVVISVPNVAHGSIRLSLLAGDFDYRDEGLLDRTHLQLFTLRRLEAMLAGAGLGIEQLERVMLGVPESEIPEPDGLPAGIGQWVREQPEAATYQFVVCASADAAGTSPPSALDAASDEPEDRATLGRLEAEARHLRGENARLREHVAALDHQLGQAVAVPSWVGRVLPIGSRRHRLVKRLAELVRRT